MALQPYRTLTLGTYAEWEARAARWIWTDLGFVALLTGAMVIFFVALYIVYRALEREALRATGISEGARAGRGV